MTLRNWIKKYTPKQVLGLRHLCYALFGAYYYRFPSKSLYVIGVTGTSGKSTTIHFLRQLLESAGFRVGSLSTIDFYVAGEQVLNDKKMTMLGKMAIQKYLRRMVEKKCDIAIIETTSEGRLQHRHRGIHYDAMVITNLYEEHIDSHGSFNNYKQAKKDLFRYVSRLRKKNKNGLSKKIQRIWDDRVVPKAFIINTNIPQAAEFSNASDGRIYSCYNAQEKTIAALGTPNQLVVDNVKTTHQGIVFTINNSPVSTHVYGEFNACNILFGVALCQQLGVSLENSIKHIASLDSPPGRLENIPEAEQLGISIIVDYAFEPVAIQGLYNTVSSINTKKIIHVFGSTGGGRDVARRFSVGRLVGKNAHIAIITNDDPYDDDPKSIIRDIAKAVKEMGKKEEETLFCIEDRRAAIEKAITLAQPGDIILVTGKGSEQAQVFENGRMEPWDDRLVVKEILNKFVKK
tara:strand:+ start:4847 stop:6226 length:1380 start_codon:yes stop_codon:yes gene_type:complete